jgi:NhaA family Na+:H+ antiporter
MAALGGMVVPALIYVAFNAGTSASDGWGIPMATDIAFALGVVALLGSRVPQSVKIFLLTLAIVDDIGAIVVIAVFYSHGLEPAWMAACVGVIVLVIVAERVHIRYTPLYVAAGVVLWFATYESGVHATIAGVVIGLLTPAVPFQSEVETETIVQVLDRTPGITIDDVRAASYLLRESVSPAERAEVALHPWVSYLVVPIFALANAGITFTSDSLSSHPRVLLGVRLGIGRLPEGVGWDGMSAIAMLAGIGFTVALFVTNLAFDDVGLQDAAKVGILIASAVAAAAGATMLLLMRRPDAHQTGENAEALETL